MMICTYISNAWLAYQARAWLENSPNKALLAAECMFALNRHVAGVRFRRQEIYTLKNNLIRMLYNSGYCTHVALHKQTLICHGCGGTGEYRSFGDGDMEWSRCYGTGIYAINKLHYFEFNIDGKIYKWHQPSKLVDWPVDIPAEDKYKELDSVKPIKKLIDDDKLADLYIYVVDHFTNSGVYPFVSFGYCVKRDLAALMRWPRRRLIRLGVLRSEWEHRIFSNVLQDKRPVAHFDEDEIPF